MNVTRVLSSLVWPNLRTDIWRTTVSSPSSTQPTARLHRWWSQLLASNLIYQRVSCR